MNYSSMPNYVYTVMPWLPPDVRLLFDVVMIVFIISFFIGIHYRMHVVQHLVPPPYCWWLRERFLSLKSRWSSDR
jgi:hypothetical protein